MAHAFYLAWHTHLLSISPWQSLGSRGSWWSLWSRLSWPRSRGGAWATRWAGWASGSRISRLSFCPVSDMTLENQIKYNLQVLSTSGLAILTLQIKVSLEKLHVLLVSRGQNKMLTTNQNRDTWPTHCCWVTRAGWGGAGSVFKKVQHGCLVTNNVELQLNNKMCLWKHLMQKQAVQ